MLEEYEKPSTVFDHFGFCTHLLNLEQMASQLILSCNFSLENVCPFKGSITIFTVAAGGIANTRMERLHMLEIF